jgi:hypothetical protein
LVVAAPHTHLPAVADTVPNIAAHFAGVTTTAPGTDIAQIGRHAVHLGAFERVVLPVAEDRLDDGAARAAELRRHGHELSTALHWLDRTVTGDVRVAGYSAHAMSQDVRTTLATYVKAEQALMSALAGVLNGHEIVELISSYHRASLMAPTRGHPRLSYRGRRGWLMFKLAAFFDDVRDGTDNRPVRRDVWATAEKAMQDVAAVSCQWRAAAPATAAPAAALPAAALPAAALPAAALPAAALPAAALPAA